MVLLLRRDVAGHISRSGGAHGEGGVSGLPTEPPVLWELFVYPARRIGLHDSRQVRYRFLGRHVHKQVNVIRRTIDYQWNTLSFSHDAGHVGEQAGSQPWRQVRGAILGGKDDVNEHGGETVWHRLTPRSGARLPAGLF